MSVQTLGNLIENFVKTKVKNQYGNVNNHTTDCMCVDHLLKKRATGKLALEKYISNHEDKLIGAQSVKPKTISGTNNDTEVKPKTLINRVNRINL